MDFELRPPNDQNALDIFAGEWTSDVPSPDGVRLTSGGINLFADNRVLWAIQALGGVTGKRILELGPLEGAHSFMLDRAGASEVIAIEANRRAYLRCLVTKEIVRLERVRFALGDFVSYVSDTNEKFDVVFACGVLYHQSDPIRMLAHIARLAPAVFIWTHYYDAERIAANSAIPEGKFGPLIDADFEGHRYRSAEYRYLAALDWAGFSGGSQPEARWLPRDDIMSALGTFGFHSIDVAFEEPDHLHGPAFALIARR